MNIDEERPIDQFLGFLKLVGALVLIIFCGLALVLGLLWYLSPEPSQDLERVTSQPVQRLPAYKPSAPSPENEPAAVPQNPVLTPELAQAEADYRQAKVELEAALQAHPAPPTDIAEDIGVVERAIIDVVSALALNPENEFLQRTLLGSYERQVDLLRKSVDIARERDAHDRSSNAKLPSN